MRRAILALLLLAPSSAAAAQEAVDATNPAPATVTTVAGASALPDSARRRLELVRADTAARAIAFDTIVRGGRVVGPTERVPGSLAVIGGDLVVRGVIDGDAVAIDGDVVVQPGGRVHGNAFAAFGQVQLAGGLVQGQTRVLRGDVVRLPWTATARREADLSPWDATMRAMRVVLGSLAVLLAIGIAAFMFAGSYLEAVAETIERQFTRAFWAGVLGQLALLPALLIVVLGLAITILGILLIPFAVVAFALAAAGVITLGALAVAQVTGRSVMRRGLDTLSPRGAALKALMVGLIVYMGAWVLAAAVVSVPVLSFVVGAIAFVLSWVAATVGLGAVLLSRGGTRRVETAPPAPAPAADVYTWQTPTPVTGVVAARRPTPAPSARGTDGS